MAITDDRPGTPPGSDGDSESAARSDRKADADTATMTLFEHLAELRSRLIVAIIAVALGGVVVWFLYDPIIRFMLHPYREFLIHNRSKDIPGSRSCRLPTSCCTAWLTCSTTKT